MRIERTIALAGTDGVGPTKVTLLTAGSAKLPVVVVDRSGDEPCYFVFDVASLQGALAGQQSTSDLAHALDLQARQPRAAVPKSGAATGEAGAPVVENGRLIGVLAADIPEREEPSEQDMARGETAPADSDSGRKRGLWQRLSRSDR